ncbi:phytanoyl-CoA dioxygenase family protein [Paenibacillus sacheonensis]|uniref:Phytanoyl-CoA dioxygenase family protein n=1 Tax=Paenibacillus sacheonensis TaxID=742054 RepID=A0A7X4YTK5_9BACL|nr:phytanoyl-CoA dioxygenase family protein [Paenibacillus sacheonensis]MBM7567618.1 ectoine hydroxylase-related dioxygenase (phytanoyl-CoA dioxygenase family) [Paenibacillus sacheonensis]NBC71279.1 hypothetical protein [Paenibacillus sacheonensis]
MSLQARMTTKKPVTPEQVEFYQTNGFVQVDNILTSEELAELREITDELMSMDNDTLHHKPDRQSLYFKVLNQRVNVWRDHARYGKYSFHPRLAEAARLLLKTDAVRFFHHHALIKNPQDSKPTAWHQDFPSWPIKESGAMSIWIALDDVDEHNGCMMFVPGSHKVGKLKPHDLTEHIDLEDFAKGTDAEKRNPVICRMKAGSCTFHDGLTFHYAHANNTDRPRRALAIIYYQDGAAYDGKAHLVTDGYNHPIGEPLAGVLHPILARQPLAR